jgi:hypothetical protein
MQRTAYATLSTLIKHCLLPLENQTIRIMYMKAEL